jgi:hypothetical protein
MIMNKENLRPSGLTVRVRRSYDAEKIEIKFWRWRLW